MNYETKRKIKKFFKDKWKWFVASGVFLLVGGTVALIGFQMSGWSLIKWLQSPFAQTTLVFVVAGAFLIILAFLVKKNIDSVEK